MLELCLTFRAQTNFYFRKGLSFRKYRPTLTPPCGRGGRCPSNVVRVVESGEASLALIGFPYVRTMPCPSSETRIDGSKEFVLRSEGFLYVRTLWRAGGLGRGRGGCAATLT